MHVNRTRNCINYQHLSTWMVVGISTWHASPLLRPLRWFETMELYTMLPRGCCLWCPNIKQIWMNSGCDKLHSTGVLAHWPQTVERFERSQRVCVPWCAMQEADSERCDRSLWNFGKRALSPPEFVWQVKGACACVFFLLEDMNHWVEGLNISDFFQFHFVCPSLYNPQWEGSTSFFHPAAVRKR